MRVPAQIVNRLDGFDSMLEAISHNIATLQRMIDNFGDRLQVATVSELAERKVIFVEDGNHGENRPRQDEFAADAFAAQHTPAAALRAALVKLYRDNATTLTPDPVYSRFYDSHPPALTRIARLRELAPGS